MKQIKFKTSYSFTEIESFLLEERRRVYNYIKRIISESSEFINKNPLLKKKLSIIIDNMTLSLGSLWSRYDRYMNLPLSKGRDSMLMKILLEVLDVLNLTIDKVCVLIIK